MEVVHTIGRRKKAVARVYLTDGKGAITVNGRDVKDYFSTATLQYKLEQAQALAGVEGQYDIKVNVEGGGITGQAEAIRLGISRALIQLNPDHRLALNQKDY